MVKEAKQLGEERGHITGSAKSRTLLREVNKQIRSVVAGFGVQDAAVLVLCECDRPLCLERLEVPLVLFDEVSSDGGRFVVIAGHEASDDERIVASDGYCVVRPRGPELHLAPQQPLPAPHPLPAA